MKEKIKLLILICFCIYFNSINGQTKTVNYPRPNQYISLQEKLDGSYHIAYGKWLWIKYEELYGDNTNTYLCYSIYDEDRNIIFKTNDDGTWKEGCSFNPVSKKYGLNWLQLNLSCSSIVYEKFYYLEVWNSKGEKFYLRFYCTPMTP